MTQEKNGDISNLSISQVQEQLQEIAKAMFISRFSKALGKPYSLKEARLMKTRRALLTERLSTLLKSSQGVNV